MRLSQKQKSVVLLSLSKGRSRLSEGLNHSNEATATFKLKDEIVSSSGKYKSEQNTANPILNQLGQGNPQYTKNKHIICA